ncbi:MAG TPA: T9SS type A sorting domain-containing protein [Bacteroidia bacterium]|jgi:hypothetical protein
MAYLYLSNSSVIYYLNEKETTYIVGGYSRVFLNANTPAGILAKLDSSLGLQWVKRYGELDINYNGHFTWDAGQTPDKGFVSSGLRLVKTDSLGNSGCFDSTVSYMAYPYTYSIFNVSPFSVIDTISVNVQPEFFPNLFANSTSEIVLCFTGTNEMQDEWGFELFPNPAREKLTLEYSEGKGNGVVYDMYGRKMISAIVSSDRIEMDVSGLPAGIYFIRLTYGEKVAIRKFLKQ